MSERLGGVAAGWHLRNLTRLRRGGGLGRGVDLVIGGGPVASDRDRRRVVGGAEGWAICGGEAG